LKGISGYNPQKTEYATAAVETIERELGTAEKAMLAQETAWQKASDDLAREQWAFHNAIIGVKQQVVAQFGDDSDEAQAVGLKKKSERKKPVRKAKKNQPA
jgi:hypothetical protein